jgi:hypothetical protein
MENITAENVHDSLCLQGHCYNKSTLQRLKNDGRGRFLDPMTRREVMDPDGLLDPIPQYNSYNPFAHQPGIIPSIFDSLDDSDSDDSGGWSQNLFQQPLGSRSVRGVEVVYSNDNPFYN